MLVKPGPDDPAPPSGNGVSKYPNSRLRRANTSGPAPVNQRGPSSLTPPPSSSPSSSPSSPPSSSSSSSRRPSPSGTALHPSATANSWRSTGPPSPGPSPKPTDRGTWSARRGAIGHLPRFSEARHGDSCLAKELRAGGLSERGFFGHPVLILSEPNEEGIVKIFPMTSFDGKTVEQKWSGIACPQRKEAMIGRYLQIAHPGIKSSIPEVRLANGQHLQKRTYLYTEVCWKVEASMLARFGHGDGLFLEEASLKTVLKTAARK
ncbi:hypothetical protein IWX49DRAFT_627309 [Phyllosticta citricarpa]